MSQAPPPPGPPSTGPRGGRSPSSAGRRGLVPLVLAALLGLLIGIGATVAVGAVVGGGGDEADLACAAFELAPDDASEVSVQDGGVDGLAGAAGLLIASAGGEEQSEAYEIGDRVRRSIALNDVDDVVRASADARAYCADH